MWSTTVSATFPIILLTRKGRLERSAIQRRRKHRAPCGSVRNLEPGWRLVLARLFGYGSADILARIEQARPRTGILVLATSRPEELARWVSPGHDFCFPIALTKASECPCWKPWRGTPVVTLRARRSPKWRVTRRPGRPRHRLSRRGTAPVSWERGFETGFGWALHGTARASSPGRNCPPKPGVLSGSCLRCGAGDLPPIRLARSAFSSSTQSGARKKRWS